MSFFLSWRQWCRRDNERLETHHVLRYFLATLTYISVPALRLLTRISFRLIAGFHRIMESHFTYVDNVNSNLV